MAPRASIMVLVLHAAFLSPSQSLALKSSRPSGACQINSGLNAGKRGTYDTKQDPGHVYCCAGDDCTECTGNACTSVRARGGATDPLAPEQIVARQGEGTIKIAVRRDDDCANNDGCCVVHAASPCQFPLRSKSGTLAMFAAMRLASWRNEPRL